MAGQLVMKNTFWELEMSPEELPVQQHRQRAYTDICEFIFKSTDLGSSKSDLGSPRSTAMGSSLSSSGGSVAGDASDRWADICDSDDDLPSQPDASFSSTVSLPPSRPEGTWFSPPPSRPEGTWFLPCAAVVAGYGSSLKVQSTTAPDARTTLIVKNLPAGCTHEELRKILDEIGLGGYNFIYVPFDFKKSTHFRYGFVNFEEHEQAVRAMEILDGFSGWVVDGEMGCEVEWSGAQQSLLALIERYRNNSVMHVSVPAAYKPLLFEQGVRIVFPAPTKAVNPPKHADKLETEQLTVAHDNRTTLIVKNLPEGCTHNELRRMLDEVGLGGMYNFIYIPFDFKKSAILRYGFVNFEQNEQAVKATAILDGFSGFVVDGEKGFEVEWGDAQQSFHSNIERYRNSPVMHGSVSDAYKPVIFERGERIAFPAPTQVVKPLKLRRAKQQ